MWKVFDGIASDWDSLLSEKQSLQQYSFWGNNKVNDGWETIRLIKNDQSGDVLVCVQVLIKKNTMLLLSGWQDVHRN